MSTLNLLNHFLEPLADILTPEVAQRIVNLRASATVEARAAELATKANLGTLSAAEEAEYKNFVDAVDIIGILQAKARKYLARHGS